MKVWRHNWTRKAGRYRAADAVVVSLGKSGRTWLRVFLYAYFCRAANRPFTMKRTELAGEHIPSVMFTHDLWGYRTRRTLKRVIQGKILVPQDVSRTKPIVLLVRDPRDVAVSLFFQVTRRTNRYGGTLPEMIRHPDLGIDSMVEVLNEWMTEWGGSSRFMLLRYEDCRRDAAAAFRGLLEFLGVQPIDEAAFAHALEFSSFDNMKKLEAARQFDAPSRILAPGDVKDPDSFKTRRGIVGGFKDYLKPEDMPYIDAALARLDRRYGYR